MTERVAQYSTRALNGVDIEILGAIEPRGTIRAELLLGFSGGSAGSTYVRAELTAAQAKELHARLGHLVAALEDEYRSRLHGVVRNSSFAQEEV